jgi:hypothetical protein
MCYPNCTASKFVAIFHIYEEEKKLHYPSNLYLFTRKKTILGYYFSKTDANSRILPITNASTLVLTWPVMLNVF